MQPSKRTNELETGTEVIVSVQRKGDVNSVVEVAEDTLPNDRIVM